MNLIVYTDPAGFDALRAGWNALLNRSHTNQVFLTHDYLATWWDAYQPGDLRLIAAQDQDGAWVGIAAWFIDRDSRILRPVGCVDVTDYTDLIAAPEHRQEFYTALATWLADHRADYDHISLCNIPQGSPTLTEFAELLMAQGATPTIKPQENCPQILLPATFEDYLNSLDKKQRHELRRKLRRIEGNDEEDLSDVVKWYIVAKDHDLTAEVDHFLALMRASHPDKATFLDNPQHSAFFRAMTPKLFEAGWVQLAFLTVNGVHAAAYLNFDYQNRIGVYNSGLLVGQYAHLSCGIVLLCRLIDHAIQQKRDVFDFLRGDEEYKYRMGAKALSVLELLITW